MGNNGIKTRTNIINFLTEAAIGSSFLFIPLLARELGASNFETGLIGTAYGLAMFTAYYIFGRMADIYDRRKILFLGLLASFLSFPLQIFAASPFQLLLARALIGFCLGIFPAALLSHVYEVNKKIGEFTAFGSLGYAIGSFLAGLIAVYWKIFLLDSVFFFLAFLLALRLEIPKISFKIPFFPKKIIKNNFSLYLSFFLRHSAAHMIWIIFPLYLVSLGINKFLIGIIYFTNSFSQFFIMRKIDGFKSRNLVLIGLLLSAGAFYSFTLAKNFPQFLLTQILVAFSWSSLYVGSLGSVMERNVERATAVGLLNSTISLSQILGPFLGGLAAQYFSYYFAFYVAAFMVFFGFIIFYFLGPERKTVVTLNKEL